eukprot:CAMPEP_0174284150 /NCGR_PEP_ID=MMETSP0809-20121228/4885_1 /TAXON_ID=73025 ORGANISM="Eutreptiella gymnastica-like, Strain CCMP1594" /NCGR_SAMPLE_ID=MMETSP0809 /ASSEMBLY_ACC=CAM_ASM_000658 /LENGTH=325 /DNA_ID=CAMNT_0015379501 /DNA_START=27 /DNA_END=1004 /DNA_ORIENTATION=-
MKGAFALVILSLLLTTGRCQTQDQAHVASWQNTNIPGPLTGFFAVQRTQTTKVYIVAKLDFPTIISPLQGTWQIHHGTCGQSQPGAALVMTGGTWSADNNGKVDFTVGPLTIDWADILAATVEFHSPSGARKACGALVPPPLPPTVPAPQCPPSQQATDVWGHNPVSPFCKDAIQNALHPSALTGVRVRELCKTTFNLPTRPLAASSLAAVSCDEGQGYPGHYGNGFFIGGTITQLTVCCPVPDPTPAPSPEASPSPDPDCDLGPGHKLDYLCPYLSVLMEHCYSCYHETHGEVIICDGWSEDDVKAQCDSPVPLPSLSPVAVGV